MRLKTLKDLKCKAHIHVDHSTLLKECCVFHGELKKEAIKWVKVRISNCVYACRVGGILCKEHKFWMQRFNITEEDLK